MARLQFPDGGSRVVRGVNALNQPDSYAGRTATLYTDRAATTLADIALTAGGSSVSGSTLTLDSFSQLPDFFGPGDGTDVLYAKVTGRAGVVRVNADYDTRLDVIRGVRPQIVAADQAPGSNSTLRDYTCVQSVTKHTVMATCSDLRFVWSTRCGGTSGVGGVLPELDLPNPVYVKASWNLDGGTTRYPVSFGGAKVGTLEPGGTQLITDVIPIDVAAGTVVYIFVKVWTPFGPATTLASSASIGATSISLTAMPLISSGYMVIDTGSNLETVLIDTITGSGPYTATLANATTVAIAHNSGASVRQRLYVDRVLYNDRGEQGLNITTSASAIADRTVNSTFVNFTAATTTLSANTAIGDTTLTLAALITAPTISVDTGGTPETATVLNITGTGPYKYWLAAALTGTHNSGATVAAGAGYATVMWPPRMILANTVASTTGAPVVVFGDSVAAGTGGYVRLATSFIELALSATNPVVNLGIGGDTAASCAAFANSIGRRRILDRAYGGYLWLEYPINDVANGQTLSQVQTSLATLAALGRAHDMKIVMNTIPPQTTSTDGFMTTTNQTIVSTSAQTVRAAYNAWVLAGAGGVNPDVIFDVASQFDSGTAAGAAPTGLWVAGGTNGPVTADGIHYSWIGHQMAAAKVDPARLQ